MVLTGEEEEEGRRDVSFQNLGHERQTARLYSVGKGMEGNITGMMETGACQVLHPRRQGRRRV